MSFISSLSNSFISSLSFHVSTHDATEFGVMTTLPTGILLTLHGVNKYIKESLKPENTPDNAENIKKEKKIALKCLAAGVTALTVGVGLAFFGNLSAPRVISSRIVSSVCSEFQRLPNGTKINWRQVPCEEFERLPVK